MANIGRFLCVALPFILTLLSLILLLVACLGGVTNKSLYMFQVDTSGLSIRPSSIKSIITRDILDDAKDAGNDILDSDIVDKVEGFVDGDDESSNVTAADLGLADMYEVNLWGYCMTDKDGDKECTKPKFNWAASELNTTFVEKLGSVNGQDIEIPDEVEDGLELFSRVTKWTEIAYIVALVALAIQLLLGAFAQCSRGLSCIVFVVSGVAAIAVIAAASLSTAMSVVVVGTVESTAKLYGVKSAFHTTYLALVWTSCAFALGAAFFWMFTICCCAPEHRSNRKANRGSTDKEKLLPTGAYQPLHEPEMHGGNNPNYYNNTSYGAPRYSTAPRSDLAYEPFSHR